MEPSLVISIIGIIILPLAGWTIRNTIFKNIDEINKHLENIDRLREAYKQEFADKLVKVQTDEPSILEKYMLCKMCDQRHDFENRNSDEKFKSILAIMNTQFANLEKKVDGIIEKLK
jgi:hypothetical protein